MTTITASITGSVSRSLSLEKNGYTLEIDTTPFDEIDWDRLEMQDVNKQTKKEFAFFAPVLCITREDVSYYTQLPSYTYM